MTVRTRFAPSPTGSLHVGGARTALYCLLHARAEGGTFLLRIEDTDRTRSTEEATRGILRDLRWLGIDWDEGPGKEEVGDTGPYFQSRRLDLYERHFEELRADDRAYEAWETREELEALRAASEGGALRYRRPSYAPEDLDRFRVEGRAPVLRLEAPGKGFLVQDEILGPVDMPAEDLDDLVIRKADGYPTYHFAVVVDDYLMEVSLVLRGQEHLMNTPKHLMIYEAFGWEPPRFAHLPLIFNPQGSKMSKRDKAREARAAARRERDARGRQGLPTDDWAWLAEQADLSEAEVVAFMAKKHDRVSVATAIARVLEVSLPMIEVMDFRQAGFLPEALVNYLVLLGWSPGDDREILSLQEMIAAFTLDRVTKTPARFDLEKLRWMNGEYLRTLPVERLQEAMALWLEVTDSPLGALAAPQRRTLLELYRQRVHTFAELEEMASFFLRRPETWDEAACRKHLLRKGGLDRLDLAREALARVETWDAPSLERAVRALCDREDLGLGKIAQPLRIAVSGTTRSPGIFETLAWFDRDEVLTRIDGCRAYAAALEG